MGGGTIKSLLIWSGPGVAEGKILDRTVWLADVAPTISHLMGWPVPSEAEGAVLHQILSSHTSRFPRPEFLRRQAERLEVARREAGVQSEVRRGVDSSEPKPPSLGESAPPEEPMPEDIDGLKRALREARDEAARWRNLYEQQRSILHQD